MNELIQLLMRKEIYNNLNSRATVHLEILKEIQIEAERNPTMTLLELTIELKKVNDKLDEIREKAEIYVLPETIYECNQLLEESNKVCDKVRKYLKSKIDLSFSMN